MMGLAYIFAFAVYLAISIVVVRLAMKQAKTPKQRKVFGILAALFMYNLVFWDFLPTLILHQYYCQKESGFWVYKTAEQWRKENPVVVVGSVRPPEGMVLDAKGNGEMKSSDGKKIRFRTYPDGDNVLDFSGHNFLRGYWLNNVFIYELEEKSINKIPVRINRKSIIDGRNGEVLIERVTVDAGSNSDIRFWTHMDDCGPNVEAEKLYYKAFKYMSNGVNNEYK